MYGGHLRRGGFAFAVIEKFVLVGGECEPVRLMQGPKTCYFRLYLLGSAYQKRGDVVRSLNTDDRGQAAVPTVNS